MESLFNIGLTFKKIDTGKPTEIIKKTHVVFKPSDRSNSKPPHIRVHKFRRRGGYMS
jgi:hypothetical protein